MRIVFLNQYYDPYLASTSRLLTDVASSLAAHGHSVTVITGRSAYHPEEWDTIAEKREIRNGVEILRVGGKYKDRTSKPQRLLAYGSYALHTAYAVFRVEKPDVLVSLTTPPFLVGIGAIWAAVRRRPLVLWLMDMYPDALAADQMLKENGMAYRILRLIARQTYRACARIVALDRYMERRLIQQGVECSKIRVCRNWERGAIPKAEGAREETRRRLNIAEDEFVILYFGNLGRAHDLETIVAVMERLREEPVKLLFVGGGTRIYELKAVVAARRLDNIVIVPAVKESEIAGPMRAADVGLVTLLAGWNGIVSPSKFHALLAAGLPVLYIGPPQSEVADVVKANGVGLACDLGDVESVVSGIREWMGDREKLELASRLSSAAFAKSYVKEMAVPRIEEVLLNVAAGLF